MNLVKDFEDIKDFKLPDWNCPTCGRFAKKIAGKKGQGDYIFKCSNCGTIYGRSVHFSLEVWGEMCPHISAIGEGSIRWNELMENELL